MKLESALTCLLASPVLRERWQEGPRAYSLLRVALCPSDVGEFHVHLVTLSKEAPLSSDPPPGLCQSLHAECAAGQHKHVSHAPPAPRATGEMAPPPQFVWLGFEERLTLSQTS